MSKEAMKLALEALENAWLDASMGKGDVARHTEAITALREALAEQPAQQEPPTVAELVCVCGAEWEWRNRDWELVATPPAQRTWVGLTDEEIDAIYSANGGTRTRRQIYQAIEAKLKEKNA